MEQSYNQYQGAPAQPPSQQQQQAPPPQQQQQTQPQQFQRQQTPSQRNNAEQISGIENELSQLNPQQFPEASRLLEFEIFRLRGGIADFVDVVSGRKVKVRAKIDIPAQDYPRFNFVGKLLGPGGSTLKGIQESTMTKMAILGKGSMRNDDKEGELLGSGDPKYNHLRHKLHLQIDSLGVPSEAYYRLSHAIAEVKKHMTPEPDQAMGGPPGSWGPPVGRGAMRGGAGPRGRGGMRGRGGPPNGAGNGGAFPRGRGRGAMRGGRGAGRGGYGDSWQDPNMAAGWEGMGDASGAPVDGQQFQMSTYENFGQYGEPNYNQGDAGGKMGYGGQGVGGHPYARPNF